MTIPDIVTRVACKVDVDSAVKSDILNFSDVVRIEIGDFLLELQENPLLKERQQMDGSAFYCRLKCGCYVSWEVFGDFMKLARGNTKDCAIRILGVGFEQPK